MRVSGFCKSVWRIHQEEGLSIKARQRTDSDAFFYKHSLGNQRDVIKGNGCLSKLDSTYYYTESKREKFVDYQSKVAILARKCQQIFMAAVLTFHTGKAVVKITAVEINSIHSLRYRSTTLQTEPTMYVRQRMNAPQNAAYIFGTYPYISSHHQAPLYNVANRTYFYQLPLVR